MFERLFQSVDHALRWFIQKTLSSYAFLCLWLLRRCFRRVPLFKLVPFAYAISAIAQILFVTITYGSLSLIVMGTHHWLMTAVLLLIACLIRLRYRGYGLPTFVGLLLLLPNPDIATSSRLPTASRSATMSSRIPRVTGSSTAVTISPASRKASETAMA